MLRSPADRDRDRIARSPMCIPGSSGVTLGHRRIIILWLVSICAELNAKSETLHLAVAFFDRLIVESVSIDDLPPQALACLFCAAKLHENGLTSDDCFYSLPALIDFVTSDQTGVRFHFFDPEHVFKSPSFNVDAMVGVELKLVHLLDFNMYLPTLIGESRSSDVSVDAMDLSPKPMRLDAGDVVAEQMLELLALMDGELLWKNTFLDIRTAIQTVLHGDDSETSVRVLSCAFRLTACAEAAMLDHKQLDCECLFCCAGMSLHVFRLPLIMSWPSEVECARKCIARNAFGLCLQPKPKPIPSSTSLLSRKRLRLISHSSNNKRQLV